jgi:predicted site-specific integrase-resolvase
MPVVINDETYYRTAEVCRAVGISRNTLFRWLKEGIFSDVEYRDWRGWRLFTPAQMDIMRARTSQVTEISRRS